MFYILPSDISTEQDSFDGTEEAFAKLLAITLLLLVLGLYFCLWPYL